jgi:hypothetical protein
MASASDSAVPPELRPAIADLDHAVRISVEKLIQPVTDLVRTANLARIAARSDPPAAAVAKIRAAAASIRAAATNRHRN